MNFHHFQPQSDLDSSSEMFFQILGIRNEHVTTRPAEHSQVATGGVKLSAIRNLNKNLINISSTVFERKTKMLYSMIYIMKNEKSKQSFWLDLQMFLRT